MAQRAGRIICPRCGANNFDTVSACWKCSTPLAGGVTNAVPPASAPMPAAQPAPSMPSMQAASAAYAPSTPTPSAGPETFAYRATAAAQQVQQAAYQMGDTARSNRAAFWLGILMPYFGYPIGLAFMMCDDKRRQEVGRICIFWSTISMVVHCLLVFVSILGMRQWFEIILGAAIKGAKSGAGGGGLGGGGFGGGLGGE